MNTIISDFGNASKLQISIEDEIEYRSPSVKAKDIVVLSKGDVYIAVKHLRPHIEAEEDKNFLQKAILSLLKDNWIAISLEETEILKVDSLKFENLNEEKKMTLEYLVSKNIQANVTHSGNITEVKMYISGNFDKYDASLLAHFSKDIR